MLTKRIFGIKLWLLAFWASALISAGYFMDVF
jgi:hypothetical protein